MVEQIEIQAPSDAGAGINTVPWLNEHPYVPRIMNTATSSAGLHLADLSDKNGSNPGEVFTPPLLTPPVFTPPGVTDTSRYTMQHSLGRDGKPQLKITWPDGTLEVETLSADRMNIESAHIDYPDHSKFDYKFRSNRTAESVHIVDSKGNIWDTSYTVEGIRKSSILKTAAGEERDIEYGPDGKTPISDIVKHKDGTTTDLLHPKKP